MPEVAESPRLKLLTIILDIQDADRLLHELSDAGWSATKVASSGGFLRRNSATIMVGVPAPDVDGVLDSIRRLCAARVEQVNVHPPTLLPILTGARHQGRTVDVHVGGAVVFVTDVERFERI